MTEPKSKMAYFYIVIGAINLAFAMAVQGGWRFYSLAAAAGCVGAAHYYWRN